MPILFNCLVAILFLLACDSVYAAEAETYVKECTETCKQYNYTTGDCDGLCSQYGAQSLYCHLGCSKNATTPEEYGICKQGCSQDNLNNETCQSHCIHVTGNGPMCRVVCVNNVEALLVRCLFSCNSQFPPTDECRATASEGAECEDEQYRTCSEGCYKEDKEHLRSLE